MWFDRSPQNRRLRSSSKVQPKFLEFVSGNLLTLVDKVAVENVSSKSGGAREVDPEANLIGLWATSYPVTGHQKPTLIRCASHSLTFLTQAFPPQPKSKVFARSFNAITFSFHC